MHLILFIGKQIVRDNNLLGVPRALHEIFPW